MGTCPVCHEQLVDGSPLDSGPVHSDCLRFLSTHRRVNGTWHAQGRHCPQCGGL